MLNILFFAQTRELIGEDSIQLEGDFATAEAFSRYQSNFDPIRKGGQKW